MSSLAKGQASDCANPALTLFARMNDAPIELAQLSFQIFDKISASLPTQIYPNSGKAPVSLEPCPDGDRIALGHYVARWLVPDTAAFGRHEIRWFYKLSAGSEEQTYSEEFNVVSIIVPLGVTGEYTTVQQVRDEGVTIAAISDVALQTRIQYCSALIEEWTGRWFYPKRQVLTLDGTGAHILPIGPPIISISSVRTLWQDRYNEGSFNSFELDEMRVYNRHLTQHLLEPDDRNNPKIQWLSHWGCFPRGTQNIEVAGVFGYTDPCDTPTGRTPRLITQACVMLVIRELAKLSDTSARDESTMRGRVTSIRTRDQSITWNASKSGVGWTGDPAIDNIIALYRRLPTLGAA